MLFSRMWRFEDDIVCPWSSGLVAWIREDLGRWTGRAMA